TAPDSPRSAPGKTNTGPSETPPATDLPQGHLPAQGDARPVTPTQPDPVVTQAIEGKAAGQAIVSLQTAEAVLNAAEPAKGQARPSAAERHALFNRLREANAKLQANVEALGRLAEEARTAKPDRQTEIAKRSGELLAEFDTLRQEADSLRAAVQDYAQ